MMQVTEVRKMVERKEFVVFGYVRLNEDDGQYFKLNKKDALLLLAGYSDDTMVEAVLSQLGDLYIG